MSIYLYLFTIKSNFFTKFAQRMKFSIITPCYNSGQFLQETMLSVLTQAGDFSIQYLLIDGGSTDQSMTIAADLKEQLNSGELWCHCQDISLEIVSESDKGMYDAIAKGFGKANGEVVAYLNADDIYLPGALQAIQRVFTKHQEINWVSARHLKIDEKGSTLLSFLPFHYQSHLLRAGLHGTVLPYVQQENVFWRSHLLSQVNLETFRSYRLAGDFYLWYCFAKSNTLYILNKNIAAFRTHQNQLSQVQRERYEQEFNGIKTSGHYSKWQVITEQVKNYKFPEFLKTMLSPTIINKI